MIPPKNIEDALRRIQSFIRETPLEFSPFLSKQTQGNIYLKLENIQISGSFKLRGALNKILSLTEEERNQGIVTASTGNHGAAVAYIMEKFSIPGIIFLPQNASKAKVNGLQIYNPTLKYFGNDCLETELQARDYAVRNGMTFVSPYNDPDVISGQGTMGLEIKRQIHDRFQISKPDTVIVPVGGGGLIAGIGSYLKGTDNVKEIVACQPKYSAIMYESIKAGKILNLESKPTLSDATAGGLEPQSITFPLCQHIIDSFILIDEKEIQSAIRLILEKHYLLIEGAAALTVAALLKEKQKFRGKNVVLIFSGAKIDLNRLNKILGK